MAKSLICIIFFFIETLCSSAQDLVFISDTQAPIWVEKIYNHTSQNNEAATKTLFQDISTRHPDALFMLGDIVSIGSSNHQWKNLENNLQPAFNAKIPVYALMGNHDYMFSKKKGKSNFNKQFPSSDINQYAVNQDSIVVIMLNANFSKMSTHELSFQKGWYDSTMTALDHDSTIKFIIVCCHQSPYSNSKVVGSDKKVQSRFTEPFLSSKKGVLFLSGHAHMFEHIQKQGKNFLVIGGGGGLSQKEKRDGENYPLLNANYHPYFHYLNVKKEDNGLSIASYYLPKDKNKLEMGYSFVINSN